MDELLKVVAGFFTGIEGVVTIGLLLFMWATITYKKFKRLINPCVTDLKNAIKTLGIDEALDDGESRENWFAAQFEEIDEKIHSISLLEHSWSEFTETLIPDPDREVVLNTKSAFSYFGRESLLGEKLNLRYFNAFPNFLTGAGILGTFMGLVAGIYLASGNLIDIDPNKTRDALQSLLGGASLAFVTSIIGLLTSIVFSIKEKHKLHEFEKLRRIWISALDSSLQRITIEEVNRKVLEEGVKQTRVLSDFSEQLAFQLATAIETKIAEPIGGVLSSLQESIEKMAENQAQASDDTLREIVDQFSESITGAAGTQMDEFAQNIQTMSSHLETQIAAVHSQQEAINQQSVQVVENLSGAFGEGANHLQQEISSSIDSILDGLSTTIEEMTSVLNATVGNVSQQLNNTASTFSASVDGLSGATDTIQNVMSGSRQLMEAQRELLDGSAIVNEKLTSVSSSINSAVERIRQSSEMSDTTVETIGRTVSEISKGIDRLASANSNIEQVWHDYQSRFENVDNSLSDTFTQIDEGIQRYSVMMKNFVSELEKNTADITGKLAGSVSENAGAIDELGEVFEKFRESLREIMDGKTR